MKHLILAAALVSSLAAAAPSPAPAKTIVIDQFLYKPATVTIAAGQTVRFVNQDDEAHTVTAKDGSFDSSGLDTGDGWTHTFTKPGTYQYFCALHPWMKGTLVVRPASGGSK